MVDPDYKTSFFHNLKSQDCTDAKVLIGDELRSSDTNTHYGDSRVHIGETPELQGPFLHSANGGHQSAILFALPTCLSSEGRRDFLHFTGQLDMLRENASVTTSQYPAITISLAP